MHFNFVAANHFELSVLDSLDGFIHNFPDFQTVWLKDETELKLLLELMEINETIEHELNNTEYSKYWDISNFKLPEFDGPQFEKFYENWIEKTNRDSDMNEYGALIFLQGLSSEWNQLKYRLVIKEEY